MSQKRVKKILAVILIAFLLLELRFFFLQIVQGKSLLKSAAAQRVVNLPVEKDRGDILDRNGISFTDNTQRILAVLEPSFLRGRSYDIERICEILDIDKDRIIERIDTSIEPILQEIDETQKNKLLELKINGVSILYSLQRYGNQSLARHIIGYTGAVDGTGEAGIEKSFEEVLKLDGERNIGAVADAKSNLIKGLGYRITDSVKKGEKLDVMLTLDFHIQKIVEDVMEKNGVKGAVVVEDVYNGDIVAIASKPDFDQNNVGKYLESDKRELFNRAVASYNLGSIFKIIDAVLFYESGLNPYEEYFCPGYIKVGNLEFKCSSYDNGGHGNIDLTRAFSQSCNPYFINAGFKMGYKNLVQMAEKFGLGKPTGIKDQGIDESPGRLPEIKKYYSLGDIANVSIGQGDIMATPLQVADMVATIANGGIKNRVNIVDSIVDGSGNKIRNYRIKGGERVISRNVADKVKYLMEQVTENGTGTKAGLVGYGGSGGKTGTAETGQYYNDVKVVHAWFAGYFPKKNPKYSIAVFVEDGKSGGMVAAPIFEEIAEEISKKGL